MADPKWQNIPRHLLTALMNSPHESVILVDRNAVVRFMSPSAADFYKLDPAQVVGKHIHQLNPDSLLPEVIRTGKAQAGSVLRMRGSERIVARIPLRDQDGNIIGAFAKLVFWDLEQVRELMRQTEVLQGRVNYFQKELQELYSSRYDLQMVVGESEAIQRAKKIAAQAARSELSLLITGETGTGKDLFAHAVHRMSSRSHKPIVKVNCGAIPQELFESEIFGYEAGAFTGASQKGKPGRFELANGGTIFLDEVGELPLAMQVKLLRVIQEQEVERLGATKPLKLDFRVIAATNQDLQAMMKANTFRQDLFYRLNTFQLHTPPLREIRQDIPRLAYHILSAMRPVKTRLPARITPEVMQILSLHDWPGNVRELKNVLERTAAMAGDGPLGLEHLPADLLEAARQEPTRPKRPQALRQEMALAERRILEQALAHTNGNRTEAARLLGIHRTGLHKKLKKHGIR